MLTPVSIWRTFIALLALSLSITACTGKTDPVPAASSPVSVAAPTAAPSDKPSNSLPPGFDVQGHRGDRGLRPEETLPAFEIALDLGVTTLELDLHFSADDQLVIWHDPAIDPAKCRMDPTSSLLVPDPDDKATPPAHLALRRLTAAQLSTYLCDRNPDAARFPAQLASPTALAGADFSIITLAQLFDFVDAYAADPGKSAAQRATARQVRFNIETKRVADQPETIGDGFDGVHPGPFELAILALVQERGLADRVTIQSFDLRSLWAVHLVAPDMPLVALSSKAPRSGDLSSWAEAGATVFSPSASVLTPALLAQAHDLGLLVIPWTVNEPDAMRALIDMGVDGLISDRPDLLLSLK